MGPLHVLVRAELCGWDTVNGGTINEALSLMYNEISIVLYRGSGGPPATFEASLFSDIRSYMYISSDQAIMDISLASNIVNTEPVKCPATYSLFKDAS